MRQSALDILEVALRHREQGPNLVERLEALEAALELDVKAEDKERNEPSKPFLATKTPRAKVWIAVRGLLEAMREYQREIVGSLPTKERTKVLIEIAVDENLARLQHGEPRMKTNEIVRLFESLGVEMTADNARRTYKEKIDNKTFESLHVFQQMKSAIETLEKSEIEKKKQEPKVVRGPKHSCSD